MKTPADEPAIRRIWPLAVWMPWDVPPPPDVRVRRVDRDRLVVGNVLRAYEPKSTPSGHCPSCTCVDTHERLRGLWEVEWEQWWVPADGPPGARLHVEAGTPHAERTVSLEYPPALVPA